MAKLNPASKDDNFISTLMGVSSTDGKTPVVLYADPTTHRLLTDTSGGISSLLQTDTFTSTNNQTIFTASANVAATVYLAINGAIQTPSSDYTVAGGVATLASGVPAGVVVVWCYVIS